MATSSMHSISRVVFQNYGSESGIINALIDCRKNGEIVNTIVSGENSVGKTTMVSGIISVFLGFTDSTWVQAKQNSNNPRKDFFRENELAVIAIELAIPKKSYEISLLDDTDAFHKIILGAGIVRKHRSGDGEKEGNVFDKTYFLWPTNDGPEFDDLPLNNLSDHPIANKSELKKWLSDIKDVYKSVKTATTEDEWANILAEIGISRESAEFLLQANSEEGGSTGDFNDFTKTFVKYSMSGTSFARVANNMQAIIAKKKSLVSLQESQKFLRELNEHFKSFDAPMEAYKSALLEKDDLEKQKSTLADIISSLMKWCDTESKEIDAKINDLNSAHDENNAILNNKDNEIFWGNQELLRRKIKVLEKEVAEKKEICEQARLVKEAPAAAMYIRKIEKAKAEEKLYRSLLSESDAKKRFTWCESRYAKALSIFIGNTDNKVQAGKEDRNQAERNKVLLNGKIEETKKKISDIDRKIGGYETTIRLREKAKERIVPLLLRGEAPSDAINRLNHDQKDAQRKLEKEEKEALGLEENIHEVEKKKRSVDLEVGKLEATLAEKEKIVLEGEAKRKELADNSFFRTIIGQKNPNPEDFENLKIVDGVLAKVNRDCEDIERKIDDVEKELHDWREKRTARQWSEAEKASEKLAGMGISFNPGFRWLAESGFDDEKAAEIVENHASRLMGLVAASQNDFEKFCENKDKIQGISIFPLVFSPPMECWENDPKDTVILMPEEPVLWNPRLAKEKIEKLSSALGILQSEFSEVNKKCEEVRSLRDKMNAFQTLYPNGVGRAELDSMQKELAEKREEQNNLLHTSELKKNLLKTVRENVVSIKEEVEKLSVNIRKIKDFLDNYQNVDERELSRAMEEKDTLAATLETLETEQKKFVEKIARIENEEVNLLKSVKEKRRELEKLSNAAPCNEDIKIFEETDISEYRNAYEDAKREIDDFEGKFNEATIILGRITEDYREFEERNKPIDLDFAQRLASDMRNDLDALQKEYSENYEIARQNEYEAVSSLKKKEKEKTQQEKNSSAIRDENLIRMLEKANIDIFLFTVEKEKREINAEIARIEKELKDIDSRKAHMKEIKHIGEISKSFIYHADGVDAVEISDISEAKDICFGSSSIPPLKERAETWGKKWETIKNRIEESWNKVSLVIDEINLFAEKNERLLQAEERLIATRNMIHSMRTVDLVLNSRNFSDNRKSIDKWISVIEGDINSIDEKYEVGMQEPLGLVYNVADKLAKAGSISIPGNDIKPLKVENLERDRGKLRRIFESEIQLLPNCEVVKPEKVIELISETIRKAAIAKGGLKIRLWRPDGTSGGSYTDPSSIKGSGAQTFAGTAFLYFIFARLGSQNNAGGGLTFVMDNPFGRAKSGPILKSVFSLAEACGVKLLIFTAENDINTLLLSASHFIRLRKVVTEGKGFVTTEYSQTLKEEYFGHES